MDRLRRSFPASIRRALNELPRTLDETYERILLEIDEEKQEYAIRLFQCLAFTRRPLRVKELAEVIAVELDVGNIPRLNVNLRPGDADEAVLSACSTMVTIIPPDNPTFYDSGIRVVQFSHYSVKEFLTSERLAKSNKENLSQFYISPEPAHTILAQSCISTLLQPDRHIGGIADSFPLAKYAAQNWFHHAQCDGVASQIQDGIERLFDRDRKHFTIWISIHDIDDPWPWGLSTKPKASPLYYASICGIGSLVEHLLITRQQDPNGGYGSQGTPLHAAVVSGHTTIAQLLLDHSADVNAWDVNAKTPLHEAASSGNMDIVRLLLSRGADISTLDYWGDSPLHKAVRSHKVDVVELLLEGGVDVNVQSMCNPTLFNPTPLHEAIDSRYLDIAQLLLSHGADVHALDNQEDSLLHKAVRSQNLGLVELLLKGGADVNVWSRYNPTPLHEAVDSGNLGIAQLLLNYGAAVNALSHQGGSPLHKAIRSQKPDVVELLLKGGADVNSRNVHYSTLLHEAAESGNIDTMKILLRHGADVNALDCLCDSPLHKALQSQNVQLHATQQGLAQLLLGYGADVNARGRYLKTPLHLASESFNGSVMRHSY